MRLPGEHGVDRQLLVKHELLWLVLAVLLVDALFIAGFFLFHLERAAAPPRGPSSRCSSFSAL